MMSANQGTKSPRSVSPAFLIALAYILALLLTTKTNATSGNDSSRFAAIESLVEQGTFAIDESVFGNTIDRVEFKGHFYSNKAPLFSLFGAGWYWVISRALGVSFASDEKMCRRWESIFEPNGVPKTIFQGFLPRQGGGSLTVYLVTLLTVGFPALLLLVLFYKATGFVSLSTRWRVFLTSALGFGTLLFSYSGTMNNHTPAAFLIFASFYLLMKSRRSERPVVPAFGCGFFAGLAFAVEAIPGFFFAITFLIAALLHSRKSSVFFALGATGPVFLFIATNLAVTGTPLPPEMYPERMLFPGSIVFRYSQTIQQLPGMTEKKLSRRLAALNYDSYKSRRILEQFRESARRERSIKGRAFHLYHMLAGSRGYFSLSSVMIIAMFSTLFVITRRAHPFRAEAFAAAFGSLATVFFHATFISTLGGQGFGNRFLLSTIPVLFFFNTFFFKEERFRPARGIFYICLCLSVAAAVAGSVKPWMWSFKA